MNWQDLIRAIDPVTAKAFVSAVRNVVDALLVESERVEQTEPLATRDYNRADLPRRQPAGGWLSPTELRASGRAMAEALAAEKWTDGFLAAIKLVCVLGGAL